METPRPAVLSLDEREARCAGAREKLGDVLGPATFTMVSGESLEIQAATTVSVRASLAEKVGCSQADVLLLKGEEFLSNALRPIRFSLFDLGSALWS